MTRLYEPIRILNEDGSFEDWSYFGITKDDEGYLWMLDRAFGRETKRLTEDRRFTRNGARSMKNGYYSQSNRADIGTVLFAENETEEEKILRLLHDPEYTPLVPLREQIIEEAVLIWKDASLTREQRQQKIADLRQSFVDAVHGRTEELRREQEERIRREEEAKKRRAEEARRREEWKKIEAERAAAWEAERVERIAQIRENQRIEEKKRTEALRTAAVEAHREARNSYLKEFHEIRNRHSWRDVGRILRTAITYLNHPTTQTMNALADMGLMTRTEAANAQMVRQRHGEDRLTWDRDHREVKSLLDSWEKSVPRTFHQVMTLIPLDALRSGVETYEDLYG